MTRLQNVLIGSVRSVLGWVPATWLPGGRPDALIARRSAVGQPAARVDGALKVTGQARFAAEVPMAQMCYAALVHSTVTRGRITCIDSAAADAAPGVILVMTHQNMPRLGMPAMIGGADLAAAGNSGLPIMQDAEVRYNGQVVALVLAETQQQADHAAALLHIDYAAAPARTRFDAAKPDAHEPASILFDKNRTLVGDAEGALRGAAFGVDRIYHTPPLNHNAIELHAVTVAWEGDTLQVHDATQMIVPTAKALAGLFNIKEEQVRVMSPFVGGGFGGKGFWDHQVVAVAAARLAGRPVRLMLSRESVYRMIGGRSPSEQRVAIGADAQGRFTALLHTGYSVKPPYAACPEQYTSGTRSQYRAQNVKIVQRHLDLDIVPNTFMRGPGEAIGTFALESAVDELACKMGLDPVELRLRNFPEQHPLSGQPFSQHAAHQCWRDGAQRFGWQARLAEPRARRDGEWLIGMGCAAGSFPYARMPGNKVRLTVRQDGSATVATATHEMGMGTATAQAQHAADRLGLALEHVTFELGDSALPAASMAGGSSQTVSLAAAIMAAADELAEALLRLAGKDSVLAGLRLRDVQLIDGGIASIAEPSRHQTYAAILAHAGQTELTVTGSGSAPLEMFKFAMHSTSAVFCELRVSAVTGEVRVDRLLGAFDVGRILNPKTAASQFRGGMIMGLGLALTEETLFDERSGRIMNATLADYHIPAHLDVPDIDVMWTDIPDPRSPLGARGIGEIGSTGVAAAIANAVYNATGTRVRSLPITLDKLL